MNTRQVRLIHFDSNHVLSRSANREPANREVHHDFAAGLEGGYETVWAGLTPSRVENSGTHHNDEDDGHDSASAHGDTPDEERLEGNTRGLCEKFRLFSW